MSKKTRAMKNLELTPISISEAKVYVSMFHRHHGAPVSGLFAVAVSNIKKQICGVAIIGRPVARGLNDGYTAEVTRLVTDGEKNACSALYGAAWRACRALGYKRLVTYILASEKGTSLIASGWKLVGSVKGRSWSCKSRPRVDKHPLQDKLRFEVRNDS